MLPNIIIICQRTTSLYSFNYFLYLFDQFFIQIYQYGIEIYTKPDFIVNIQNKPRISLFWIK